MKYDTLYIRWSRVIKSEIGDEQENFDKLFLSTEEVLEWENLDNLPDDERVIRLEFVSYGPILKYVVDEGGWVELIEEWASAIRKKINSYRSGFGELVMNKNAGQSGEFVLVFEYDLVSGQNHPEDPEEWDEHFVLVGYLDAMVEALDEMRKLTRKVTRWTE